MYINVPNSLTHNRPHSKQSKYVINRKTDGKLRYTYSTKYHSAMKKKHDMHDKVDESHKLT